jgi:hypothetical protein
MGPKLVGQPARIHPPRLAPSEGSVQLRMHWGAPEMRPPRVNKSDKPMLSGRGGVMELNSFRKQFAEMRVRSPKPLSTRSASLFWCSTKIYA